MVHSNLPVRTQYRWFLNVFFVLLLLSVGCKQHGDTKETAFTATANLSFRHDSDQKECHENTCVGIQALSQDVLFAQQRESVRKLQAIYDTNKNLVGSTKLLKKYTVSGNSLDSLRHNTLNFTVTVETDSNSLRGRTDFEIAQMLESTLQEESYLTTNQGAKLTPVVVRLYEVHPFQHSWQLLLTFVYDSTEQTNYVFHWSDTVLGTGTYSISL